MKGLLKIICTDVVYLFFLYLVHSCDLTVSQKEQGRQYTIAADLHLTASQNSWGWKGLWRPSGPTLVLKQGHPAQVRLSQYIIFFWVYPLELFKDHFEDAETKKKCVICCNS